MPRLRRGELPTGVSVCLSGLPTRPAGWNRCELTRKKCAARRAALNRLLFGRCAADGWQQPAHSRDLLSRGATSYTALVRRNCPSVGSEQRLIENVCGVIWSEENRPSSYDRDPAKPKYALCKFFPSLLIVGYAKKSIRINVRFRHTVIVQ